MRSCNCFFFFCFLFANPLCFQLDTHIGEKLESASGIEDSALSLIGDKAQYDKDADLAAMEKMKHATIAVGGTQQLLRGLRCLVLCSPRGPGLPSTLGTQ